VFTPGTLFTAAQAVQESSDTSPLPLL